MRCAGDQYCSNDANFDDDNADRIRCTTTNLDSRMEKFRLDYVAPLWYGDYGHRYCTSYSSYKREGQLSLDQCKARCDERTECNAIGYSPDWSVVYCTT